MKAIWQLIICIMSPFLTANWPLSVLTCLSFTSKTRLGCLFTIPKPIIIILILVLTLLTLSYMWPFKNKSNTVVDNNGGIDRANELVVSYGRHIGVSDAQLDSNNDRSFGEYGFHYDKD